MDLTCSEFAFLQLVHDVAAENEVPVLKRDLEGVRARMADMGADEAGGTGGLEHLDACSVVIQTKLDLAAKLRAQKLAKEVPKPVNAEVVGLQSRLAVVERELAAARAREANMHLLLRKAADDKPLPRPHGAPGATDGAEPDTLAAQSERLVYRCVLSHGVRRDEAMASFCAARGVAVPARYCVLRGALV